jgi:hypothetical protein
MEAGLCPPGQQALHLHRCTGRVSLRPSREVRQIERRFLTPVARSTQEVLICAHHRADSVTRHTLGGSSTTTGALCQPPFASSGVRVAGPPP